MRNIIIPGVRELPNGNGSGGKKRNAQRYNNALLGMFLCAVAFLFYQTSLDQLHQRARVSGGSKLWSEPQVERLRSPFPYSEELGDSASTENYRLPTDLSKFRNNIESFNEEKAPAESQEISRREDNTMPSATPLPETIYEARGVYNPEQESEVQTEMPLDKPEVSLRIRRQRIISQYGRNQHFDPELPVIADERPRVTRSFSRVFENLDR